MAGKIRSFKHSFMERSKERLLSRKGYSAFGLGSSKERPSIDLSGILTFQTFPRIDRLEAMLLDLSPLSVPPSNLCYNYVRALCDSK